MTMTMTKLKLWTTMSTMTTDGASSVTMVVPTGLEALGDKSLQAVPAVVFHFTCSILTKYVPKSGGCSNLLLLADKVPMFMTFSFLAGGGGLWYLGFAVFLPSFALHSAFSRYIVRVKLQSSLRLPGRPQILFFVE
jgi:hypothetical protein